MKLRSAFFSLALSLGAALAADHVVDPEWTGTVTEATGDAPGLEEPKREFVLTNRHGRHKRLHISKELLQRLGGRRALRGKELEIEVEHTEEGPLPNHGGEEESTSQVRWISGVNGVPIGEPSPLAITGSKPWVSILVRFGSSTGTTPETRDWFVSRMATQGQNMDNIWRENSYEQININGSQVAGWYNLPQPRSYYVYDNNGDGSEDADLNRIANDAIALADPDVHFPSFAGVAVMINESIGCCAWGGGFNINRDGVNRGYSFAWMPPWGFRSLAVLAHEMGHGFGLPHSSGPYDQTYDSKWDFMSGASGDNPPHTISFHKELLEWITPSRRFVPAVGSVSTVFIERMAFPPNAAGTYGMARLPVSGSDKYYTIESRLRQGYDANIPGEGVVIHYVDTARGDRDAQVVDSDNNGNCNDAGAMWAPGETFNDAANQISVEVLSSNASGHSVRISYKANVTPTFTPTSVPANGNGACASYWNNRTLTGAACAMRTESQVNFDWATGGPAGTTCGTLADLFSARFSASLEAPYAGTYTLYLRGDDGIRLWVTNPANNVESLLIDQWIDQGPTEYSATLPFSLNAGQRAPLRVEYYENGGGALVSLSYSGPNTPKQVVPQGRLYSGVCALPTPTFTNTQTFTNTPTPTFTPTAPPALGNGLCASYWNNRTLAGDACAMRTESQVNFDWLTGGPAGTPCGALADNFSARFSGSLEAPYAGIFTLYLRGDDGIRLWVTNPANNVETLLINQWIDQSPTEYSAALPFSLSAGQKAPIRVEYYENGGGALVSLSYSGPNTPKQAVPQGRLYSGACTLATSTPTHTPSNTATATETRTFTHTHSSTSTGTATSTFTQSNTFTDTATPTDTATATDTFTATNSFTHSNTFTHTSTFTSTHTFTNTNTRTNTSTATHTFTATKTSTPTFTPSVPPASGNGVCASYWNNRTLLNGACAMRTEANVNFNWGTGGPTGTACGAITDNFSARFTGSIEAPYAGTYTLYLAGDDGIRLWVTNPANGAESLLIDRWIDQGVTEYSAVLGFSLAAGQKAPFRVEYYENGGGALVSLSWSGPNTPKQVIPQGRIYSSGCVLPTATFTPAVAVQVEFRIPDTGPTSDSPHPQFLIGNRSAAPIQLTEYELRYWFNCDCGGTAMQAWVDWTSIPGTLVDLVSTSLGGQTHYLRVRFTQGYSLQPGANAEVHTRYNRADWANVTQTNDWSFTPQSAYLLWNRVTLYRLGARVYGQEPAAAVENPALATGVGRESKGKEPALKFLSEGKKIIAGPNPAVDEVKVAYLSSGGRIRLTLLNWSRETVAQKDLGETKAGEQVEPFSVAGLAPGVYHLVLLEDTGSGWRLKGNFKVGVKRR